MTAPTKHEVILNPPRPGIEKNSRETYKYLYELWKRSGGYESQTLNLKGLTVSVGELNMLSGIKVDETVQTQLNAKPDFDDLGTMAYQNSDLVNITGGTINDTTRTGGSISSNAISGGTINATAISSGSITNAAMTLGTISGTAISLGTIDNAAITNGTIEDATITNSSVTLPAGTSGEVARASGNLEVNISSASNVGTAETLLLFYTLKANSLNTDTSYVQVHAWGFFNTGINNRTLRLYIGSSGLLTTGLVSPAGGAWSITGKIVRTAPTSAVGIFEIITGNTDVENSSHYVVVGEDFGIDNNIYCTGQGQASLDIIQIGLTVEWRQK